MLSKFDLVLGSCTVKSAYFTLSSSLTSTLIPNLWNWIWSIKTLPKSKMFIWRCDHNRLPTKNRIFHTSPYLKICPKHGSVKTTNTCNERLYSGSTHLGGNSHSYNHDKFFPQSS